MGLKESFNSVFNAAESLAVGAGLALLCKKADTFQNSGIEDAIYALSAALAAATIPNAFIGINRGQELFSTAAENPAKTLAFGIVGLAVSVPYLEPLGIRIAEHNAQSTPSVRIASAAESSKSVNNMSGYEGQIAALVNERLGVQVETAAPTMEALRPAGNRVLSFTQEPATVSRKLEMAIAA